MEIRSWETFSCSKITTFKCQFHQISQILCLCIFRKFMLLQWFTSETNPFFNPCTESPFFPWYFGNGQNTDPQSLDSSTTTDWSPNNGLWRYIPAKIRLSLLMFPSHSIFVVRDSTLEFLNVTSNLKQSFTMRHWSLTIRCWFSMRHSNYTFSMSRVLSDMLSCYFMLGCHFMRVSLFNSRHAWMGTWIINRCNTLYFSGPNPIWRGVLQAHNAVN